MRFTIVLVLLVLGGFTGTALAANAASDPSTTEIAKTVLDAVMHSNWWAAAAYGVILAVMAVRYFLPAAWKTGTKGDIVGTALAFVLAFAGAVGTVVIAPGAVMTAGVALTALKVGVAAIGVYNIVHKVAGWLLEWEALPSFLRPVLTVLTSLVGSNAVAKAEAAGAAAVQANPPTGLAGDATIREVK